MPSTEAAAADARLAFELGVWLLALRSFFDARNHPLPDSPPAGKLNNDWVEELRVARAAVREISKLSAVSGPTQTDHGALLLGEGFADSSESFVPDAAQNNGPSGGSLSALRKALRTADSLCAAVLESRPVSFKSWEVVGKTVVDELYAVPDAYEFARQSLRTADATLQSSLVDLARERVSPPNLSTDIMHVFTLLARGLEWLRFVEKLLERDQPLKQTLVVFALVHEEARKLVEFIEKRALANDGCAQEYIDGLDATGYAIKMELRKVFSHELLALTSLRQAPPVKVKVETAHGLLRNCFQQSTVALAQLYDGDLGGTKLFGSFQTLLEQSLSLRSELWKLLLLVQRAEKERDVRPIAPLMRELNTFSEGSLRLLFYKDWEACERFIEEVAAARGAVELAPVLHRFGTYLRTLHGQVNMRAVLANHPFDPSAFREE